jgi:small subunit ribosomal protein S18
MPSSRKQRSRPRPTDTKSRIRRGRPKVCMLCKDRVTHVDYKDSSLLRRFMSERGKIKSRSSTGTCTQHQAAVALAIKNAREMALLPYVVRTLAGDKGGRRRGGPGGGRPDRPDRPERTDGPRPDRAAPVAEGADSGAAPAGASTPEPPEPTVDDGVSVGAVGDGAVAEPVS